MNKYSTVQYKYRSRALLFRSSKPATLVTVNKKTTTIVQVHTHPHLLLTPNKSHHPIVQYPRQNEDCHNHRADRSFCCHDGSSGLDLVSQSPPACEHHTDISTATPARVSTPALPPFPRVPIAPALRSRPPSSFAATMASDRQETALIISPALRLLSSMMRHAGRHRKQVEMLHAQRSEFFILQERVNC
jgi:hypothetical protein